ncbi:TLC domain-containing protein 2-like [Clytia hemisphaerica]|uniref:TLC domain-containing protein n=1 Tax=Clytia hemisphaerica TaxID=252671 RepID=A0A7M5XHB3_9CNID|eukprot:TCONS_00009994-protein
MLPLWNSDMYTFGAMTMTNLIGYWLINKAMKRARIWRYVVDGEVLTNRDQWMVCNIICSLIHSIVSAVWTTTCFLATPSLVEDLINKTSWWSSALIAASGGYFMYDTYDILLNDGFRQKPVLIHHVLILHAFPFALMTSSYHGFALSALLMEYSSIFLHLRRLMKYANKKPTIFGLPRIFVEMFVKVFLVLTMLVFRHLLSLFLIRHMWQNRNTITGIPFWIGITSSVVFIPVNIGLSYRVYKTKDLEKGRRRTIVSP